MNPAVPRPGTLDSLQALRALAALGVAVHHAFVYVGGAYGAAGFATRLDPVLGALGVALFFAISGFLMARLVRSTDPWTFLAHRVVRIFPPFLLVVAVFAGLFWLLRLPFTVQPLALTLAPVGPVTYPLNVEWTLVYETTFYVALFLVAWLGAARWLPALALAWLVVLVAASCLLPDAEKATVLPPPQRILLSAANVPFAAGLLIPGLVGHGVFRPWMLLSVPVALGLSLGLGLEGVRWLLGGAAFLLVGCAVQAPAWRVPGLSGPLVRLGDASYLLYLAHVPIILTVIHVLPPGLPPWPVWGLALLAAVLVPASLRSVDLGTYRRLRRAVDGARPGARRLLGLAYLLMFFAAAGLGGWEASRDERGNARALAAVTALPPASLRSAEAAKTAIAASGGGLPDSVAGEASELLPFRDDELVLGAWAYDARDPDRTLRLVALCEGVPVAVDRARRRRPDIAARPDHAAARSRRIGYRLTFPAASCRRAGRVLALLVDPDGRVGLLPGTETLAVPGSAP